jgi:hypothetical protein
MDLRKPACLNLTYPFATLSAFRCCCSTLVVTARRFPLRAARFSLPTFRRLPTLPDARRSCKTLTCSLSVAAYFTVHCLLHKNAACACWSYAVPPACVLSALINTHGCLVCCSLATVSFHCNDPDVFMHTILGPPLCSIYLVNPHEM